MNAIAVPRRMRSSGTAHVGVTQHPRLSAPSMAAVLCFNDRSGRDYEIELTRNDVHRLAADLSVLLSADDAQLCAWSLALDADAGVPTPSAAEIRSAAEQHRENGAA